MTISVSACSVLYVRFDPGVYVPVAVAEEQTGTGGKENCSKSLSLQNH